MNEDTIVSIGPSESEATSLGTSTITATLGNGPDPDHPQTVSPYGLASGLIMVCGLTLTVLPTDALAQFVPMPGMAAKPSTGPACPGTTDFSTDSFTGTAGTDLSSHTDTQGNAWSGITVVHSATLTGTGAVKPLAGTGESYWKNAATPTCANYSVTITLTNTTNELSGVICRELDNLHFYTGYINTFSGYLAISKKAPSGTALTELGHTTTGSESSGGIDTLTLTCSGTSLTVLTSGSHTNSLTVTDGDLTAAGSAGLLFYSYGGQGSGYHAK